MKPVIWKGRVTLDRVSVPIELVMHESGTLTVRLPEAGPQDAKARTDAERQVLRQLLARHAHVVAMAEVCNFSLAESPFPTLAVQRVRFTASADATGDAARRVCDAAERQQDWLDKMLRAVLDPDPLAPASAPAAETKETP